VSVDGTNSGGGSTASLMVDQLKVGASCIFGRQSSRLEHAVK
jgi:hypothetical protein